MPKEFFWLLTHLFSIDVGDVKHPITYPNVTNRPMVTSAITFMGFGNKILVLVSNLTFTDHGYRVC